MAKLLSEQELLEALKKDGSEKGRRDNTVAGNPPATVRIATGNKQNAAQENDAAGQTDSALRTAAPGTVSGAGAYRQGILDKEAAYNSSKAAMAEKETDYRSAKASMDEMEECMALWGQQLNILREEYSRTGSQNTAKLLKQAQTQMEQMLVDYLPLQNGFNAASAEFEAARRAYTSTEREYLAAMEEYNARMNRHRQYQQAVQGSYLAWPREDQELLRTYIDNRIAHDPGMASAYVAAETALYRKYGADTVKQMARMYAADRRQEEAAADKQIMEGDLREIASWTEEDRKLLQDYVENRFYGDEAGAVKHENARAALWAKYGRQRVQELAETYIRVMNRETAAQMEQGADTLTQSTGGRILGSALAVPANVLGGVTGAFGYLDNLLTGTGRYATLDPNAAGTELMGFGKRVTQNVAGHIRGDQDEETLKANLEELAGWSEEDRNLLQDYVENRIAMDERMAVAFVNAETKLYEKYGRERVEELAKAYAQNGGMLTVGDVEATVYQAGMSALENLSRIVLFGGAGSLAVAATGSFTNTVQEASHRGINPTEAVTMGIVTGGLEVLTEKVSLDNLLKQAKGGTKSIPQLLKAALISGGIEVSEEEFSFLGSLLAEAVILQEDSAYNQRLAELEASGISSAEARETANRELLQEAGATMVQSFLSGGMMSGATGAYANVMYKGMERAGQKETGAELRERGFSKDDIQILLTAAKNAPAGSEASRLTGELQKKVNAGKELSDRELGRLYQAVAQAALEEAESQAAGNVTEEADPVTEEADPVTEEPVSVTESTDPVTEQEDNATLVEQIRQEENETGGITNEQEAALRYGTGTADGGAGVSDGGSQRNAGAGAPEQTGSLAGRAGQTAPGNWSGTDRVREESRKNVIRKVLREEKVSTRSLGIQTGTERPTVRVVREEYWTEGMAGKAEQIYQETGKRVTFVVGDLEVVPFGNRPIKVNGIYTGQGIVVRIDHSNYSAEQLADHEAYHAWRDIPEYAGLQEALIEQITSQFSQEEFEEMAGKYMHALRNVIDVAGAPDDATFEARMNLVYEELLADAHAGMNWHSLGATKFTETVNRYLEDNWISRPFGQENGTRQTNGPNETEKNTAPEDGEEDWLTVSDEEFEERYGRLKPGAAFEEKYSYAGERAENADLESLARAKEMHRAGVANETIRLDTGWFRGMDGKWRWEIDDSEMQYHRAGDALFRQMHPEYERHQELMQKFLYGEITAEEDREFRELDEIWGRENQRLRDRVKRGNAQLQNLIQHDALFEAYPWLRGVKVVFGELPAGTRGQYDPNRNTITLRTSLENPMDTLLHEIQHAIQNYEGFSQGASTEYWEEVQRGEKPVRRNDRRIAETEGKIQEILDSLPPYIAGQFELHRHLEKSDPDKAMELADHLSEGLYGDQFSDYFLLTWDLDLAKGESNYIRGAGDLYRNTAGEIEARDTAARRRLTVEQRRSTEPARADDWTVFVEDINEAVIAELDAAYGPQLQSATEFDQDTLDDNIRQVAQMEPVTGITGQEFAKGEVDLITQVETFFDQRGNRAFNPELGEVILDRKGVKSDIAHGIGRKKAAAFAAVPEVIERGLVVDYQKNWKGRGYDTAVVAAPIDIGGQAHMAAIILVRSGRTNRFYVHEVLAMKNGAMPFKTGARKGDPSGDAPSILSILDKIRSVKNGTGSRERFSVDDSVDSDGNELSAEQQEYFKDSKVRDDQGRLMVMYHQTDGDFTIFDIRHPGAGSKDGGTPFGIFLKKSARDIGLTGKRQMALYVKITNPLHALDREDLDRQLREISGSYAAISDEHKRLDIEYHEKFEKAKQAWRDYVTEWRAANPGAKRDALYDDPRFNKLFDAEDAVIDEWTAAADLLSAQAKEAITEDLRKAGYDGIFLENDVGSWGRRTDAIIALNPQQVKNISNKTPTDNPDIRYSVDDASTEDYDALEAEFAARQREAKETFLRERLGDDGYRKYLADQRAREDQHQQEEQQLRDQRKEQAERRKQDAALEAKARRMVETNKRKLHVEAETAKINREEQRRLEAETKPAKAKRELKNNLLNLFSIPAGQRAELGKIIDHFADRIIKNGTLTEEDRSAFFDRMYEAGVMTVQAEEYFQEGRRTVAGGKVYVDDGTRADFGDDWEWIRKRAFAAGVYLTRNRNDGGLAMWNHELAELLPGMFDSEETDNRAILERIVQIAEEGKDEKVSLAEYTARLAQEERTPVSEFLDNMERQMDWALRSFANAAEIETQTKEREIRKQANTRRQNIQLQARLAAERQERVEKAQRQRERKELREMQQKTLKALRWLNQNQYRAPEELKEVWNEVLGDIDIYAVSAANELNWSNKYNASWRDLAQMYLDAEKNDPNFMPSKELETIVKRLDGAKIEDMDPGALADLYKAAVGLRTEFYNRNNVINDDMQRLFAEVYSDSKKEIEAAPGGFTDKGADKFLNMEQLTPMNVLQRMAGWDPDSTFYSMAKQLEQGERDIRNFTVRSQALLKDFLTEHEDWVKKADGQGKDGLWEEIEIPELISLELGKPPKLGDTIKVWITPAQKVHMYLESKNHDNLRHMTGGRTFADKKLYSEGKRQEAFAQGKTVRLAPETVKAIVANMSEEELELAKLLDSYYNGYATGEINRVSNILYGYDKAMGSHYAPIYTNQNYVKTEFGVFNETAEGIGNLKGRVYAVNPSYNISAFDAFERNVDHTARFVGMAIPARNWTTLMNWRESHNSTADVITHKWGDEGKRYISDLITRLQAGEKADGETVSKAADKLMSNYISAVFGANPSIVLKQLGSIPMAAPYLGIGNFPSMEQIRNIDRELIAKYTSELEWRTMGYATPETKQLKNNPNWTERNKFFKFTFGGGAITAMDGWAASLLWPWAENKVRSEYADLEDGSEDFYKKVAEEFNHALSRSQSVSDEMHQGTLRKSKNPITRTFTMFRSDAAQAYNALRQMIGEAKFYARTGADGKLIAASKKAVGGVVCALLLNAVWSEAVSFVMALWKNKAKYYRDEEEELTGQSVAAEMGRNMLESILGTVAGGDELAQLIGNAITGDKRYDLEAPGLEQVNDILNLAQDLMQGNFGRIRDAVEARSEGGSALEYYRKNSGEIIGELKDTAQKAATYFGIPVNNVEAYILGAMKWISPEFGAAYDDVFQNIDKSDLKNLEGDALAMRLGRILKDRKITLSDDALAELAGLYEAGYTAAVPGGVPNSITIDGESKELNIAQKQAYEHIWAGTVTGVLEQLIASDGFAEADQKTQEKMLKYLYTYAGELAKAELFDEYKLDSGATKNAAIVAAGATVAECITWNTITSEMKSGEKSAELASWDIPEEAKREIFRCKISDSREDSIDAFDEAGLSFDQFLQAYSVYGQINNEDLKAGMKAVEFSHWVNAQGYTAEQKAVIKEELSFYNMSPATAGKYDKMVAAGVDPDEAYAMTQEIGELEPMEGEDRVQDVQRWRECVNRSYKPETQISLLYAYMTEKQFAKLGAAYTFGIDPDAFVGYYEIRNAFDEDGNGSYSNAEVKAAIDSMTGYRLTKEQKAALWQIMTGSKSAKNNPYSTSEGQRVLDYLSEE